MSGVNKVFVLGNLGQDPSVRYTNNGQAVCELSIATNEKWKDKQGNAQERVEWHRVILWGKDAENAGKYLSKGRSVHVEGRLQTRSYDAKDGSKRYVTEIVCQTIQYLGGGGDRGGRGNDGPPPPLDNPGDEGRGFGGYGGAGGGGPDDDIPFIASSLDQEPSAVARVLRKF